MTTPSGPIKLSDLQTEFGGTNPISLSEYYRGGANVPAGLATSGVDGVAVATSGTIRLGTFRSVTKIVNFVASRTIASNTDRLNIRQAAIVAGWDQVQPLTMTVTINSGVILYSSSVSQPALQTGGSFPAGSSITLINNGTIQGGGGFGGGGSAVEGNTFTPAGQGQPGGNAMIISSPITIYNYGTIAGGAGGGGGGGASLGAYGKLDYYAAGGGGGGGGRSYGSLGAGGYGMSTAGHGGNGGNGVSGSMSAGGAGGPRFVVAGVVGSGAGGAGGELGQPGSPGANPDTSSTYAAGGWTPGGAGGAAGNFAYGNNNITWAVVGTRLGGVVA